MGILFWGCTLIVVCVIAGVILYKPYLGIVFVIVAIPFEDSIIFNGIFVYPLEVILAILFFACMLRHIMTTENYFKNSKLVFYYLPFMVCILLSASKFMELPLMVKGVVRWLELIVVCFLTINLITDYKKIRVVLYSMIFTTVIVSICGIVSYLSGVENVFETRPGAYVFFDHPNVLAGYVNLIIPVLCGMLVTSVFLWEKITLGISTVLSIMIWFLTFSRSAWVSLILTLILVFFLTNVKKRVAILFATLFVILSITLLSSNIKDDFLDRLKLHSTRSRAMCHSIGYSMVKDDMILGIGMGNYPLLIEKFTESRMIVRNDLHNLYLQIFVEVGIMGLCAFVFWLVCVVKHLMSSLKSLENSRDYGLLVGLIGGVIVYLFNNLANVLTVHGIHLQWGIILGLAVLLTQFKDIERA